MTANLLDHYRMMTRIVLWEQKLLWLIDNGEVSGFYHSGRGQEAIPVGACAALRPDDYMLYAHRGVGYLIAKGLPMHKLFGDFLGTIGGTTRGLGAGIVHIAWPPLGILGQGGTVGSSFPLAAGAGLSAKYRGSDQVTLVFFGEGTSNRGTFHEAANAASVWKLPIVWLCENNGYGAMVNAQQSTSVEDIAVRASAYGMPGVIVDGQDPVAVHEAVEEAVARARTGGGPTLIEAKTHRFRGHYEGDPQTYRPDGELAAIKQYDPLVLLADRIMAAGVADADQLGSISAEEGQAVDEALRVAKLDPMPGPERVMQYVYADAEGAN